MTPYRSRLASMFRDFWFPLVDIAEIVMLTRNLRNRQNSSYDTLALIAAICYTAACSVSISGDLESLGSVSIYFWRDIACQLLERSDYPSRSNLNNLRVAFFLAMPSIAEGISHPDPRSISTLVRVAQSLGLHRDPSSFNLSGHDADLSRIIWWSVRGLDTSYAIAHALPPLIHPTSTDVQNPYCDDGIECKLLRTVIRTGILISRALHKVYGVSQPTLHEIQQLDEEAEKIYAEEISGSHQPNMTSMERFVAISRMMCCCKMIFILHQPYLRTRQWPQSSRLKILKACEDYINGFVTGFKDETLAPYRWVLSHFDVIHACAIVLQDLIQHSHSPESSALRKVVEVCFSTFSRDHHVDWSRLKVLRSKAWAANQWLENGRRISIGSLETDFSLADWNALFASFTWKDLEI